jgi:hypothetical protein
MSSYPDEFQDLESFIYRPDTVGMNDYSASATPQRLLLILDPQEVFRGTPFRA